MGNQGTAKVSDSTFSSNSASAPGFSGDSAGSGGAIHNNQASARLTIERSTFSKNTAGFMAGAIANTRSAIATVSDTTFTENSGLIEGGAIQSDTGKELTLNNCGFYKNRGYIGGAVTTMIGKTTVSNSIFQGNFADRGSAIANGYGGTTSYREAQSLGTQLNRAQECTILEQP